MISSIINILKVKPRSKRDNDCLFAGLIIGMVLMFIVYTLVYLLCG